MDKFITNLQFCPLLYPAATSILSTPASTAT